MKYILLVIICSVISFYAGFIIMEISMRKLNEPDDGEDDQEQKEFLERWEDDRR